MKSTTTNTEKTKEQLAREQPSQEGEAIAECHSALSRRVAQLRRAEDLIRRLVATSQERIRDHSLEIDGIEFCESLNFRASLTTESTVGRENEKPIKIKNLKLLDAIHQVVMQYSGNTELADRLWSSLRHDNGKGATAPPTHYRHLSPWIRTSLRPPTGAEGIFVLAAKKDETRYVISYVRLCEESWRWPYWMPIPALPQEKEEQDLG